jgi:hypothetical protein
VFVRTKNIKGRDYAYLVRNIWTSEGPRQRVVRYIGAVHRPERVGDASLSADFMKTERVLDVLRGMVANELSNHGFQLENGDWKCGELSVCLKKGSVGFRGRKGVLRLNEGFMCDDTIRMLQKTLLKDKIEGKELAEAILEAGIKIEPESFVALYSRLMPYTEN